MTVFLTGNSYILIPSPLDGLCDKIFLPAQKKTHQAGKRQLVSYCQSSNYFPISFFGGIRGQSLPQGPVPSFPMAPSPALSSHAHGTVSDDPGENQDEHWPAMACLACGPMPVCSIQVHTS